jgi:hypothetical protein
MLVQCKYNNAKNLPIEEVIVGGEQSDYSGEVKIGENYLVYGIIFSVNPKGMDFLLASGSSISWLPSVLFKVINNKIPPGWEISLIKENLDFRSYFSSFGMYSMFGYPLLVNSRKHYEGLMEYEQSAVKQFNEEARRIEEWWESIKQLEDISLSRAKRIQEIPESTEYQKQLHKALNIEPLERY